MKPSLKNISHLLLLVAATCPAQAHAFLDRAEPRVGAIVASPPRVKLWLTEELKPAFSRVQVFDARGKEIDRKDSVASGATLTVSLPKLPPGAYKVAWVAVAIDTHRTTGTFPFTVR